MDEKNTMRNGSIISKWHDGIMGLVVGDALGVPVQFMSAEEIKNSSEGLVEGMRGGGTYNMPAGTWSDDSSMVIATMDSLIKRWNVDLNSIANALAIWLFCDEYTPLGKSFDVGNTCREALTKYRDSGNASTCGATGEMANGNGALMRILPVCLFYYDRMKDGKCEIDEIIKGIHAVGSITHNHLRSNMCCGFYFFMVKSILDGKNGEISNISMLELLQKGIDEAYNYYSNSDKLHLSELEYLNRILNLNEFEKIEQSEIKSSGYVIDTIEAALWSLITTKGYKECLLKAVNLGGDADTIAAVAGGLAGLFYGYECIPGEWLTIIPRREWIENLCVQAGDQKFRLGHDAQKYRDVIFDFIQKKYNWATQEILDNIIHIEIEKVDGEYQFIRYMHQDDGKKERIVDNHYHTTYEYLMSMFDMYEKKVLESQKKIETYNAPFFGVNVSHGYRIEQYEVSKLLSGDYSILVQEGDRVGGGAYTTYVAKNVINYLSYEEAIEYFPRYNFLKDKMLADKGLRTFLGFKN